MDIDKIEQLICDNIRKECKACNGSGIDGIGGGIIEVTHDMAFDAGEPLMEGMQIDNTYPIECEYCGQPIEVVRKTFKGLRYEC